MFSEAMLNEFRKLLTDRILALQEEADASLERRAVVELDQQSVGRLSRMDALQQQAMAKAAERRRQAKIARAKQALRLIDSDDYGYCEECGDPVGAARLNHDPALTLCISCARAK